MLLLKLVITLRKGGTNEEKNNNLRIRIKSTLKLLTMSSSSIV